MDGICGSVGDADVARIFEALRGKTIAFCKAATADRHYRGDYLVLAFTDGSNLKIKSVWCNDSTAAIDLTLTPTPAKAGQPLDTAAPAR